MPIKALNASLTTTTSIPGELHGEQVPLTAQLGPEPPRFCAECGGGWWCRCDRRLVGGVLAPRPGGFTGSGHRR